MFIQANISLVPGDTQPGSPNECAQMILEALGGDPAKDSCNVTMTGSGQYPAATTPAAGSAGAMMGMVPPMGMPMMAPPIPMPSPPPVAAEPANGTEETGA